MNIRTLLAASSLIWFTFTPLAARADPRRELSGVVNLNAATPEQLRLLPGVGPAKVGLILTYRRAHPFRTVDELVRIKGIGPKMVRHLRPHLAVSGPTTAEPTRSAPASMGKR
jgi:competence ComEA-like helix-hairpin-helix protein